MNKPTYCPHCWAEITNADTTCRQCGEAVKVIDDDEGDDKYHYLFIIWSVYIILIIGLILGVSGK